MTSINKLLKQYDIKPKKIHYRNNARLIETDKDKFIVKVKTKDKYDIYRYLDIRNFHNYLPLENTHQDAYEIYRFIEDKLSSTSDKAIDLVYILSMLHIKTTTYEETNLDQVKKVYEETIQKINYLNSYYLDLQDYIETKVYMSPAEYLLIRNVTKVYSLLNFSKEKLEIWYKEKSTIKKERQVLLHSNLTLDHFLEGENNYLINWNKARKGPVIYDFLNFYQNEYLNLEMESLFEIYQSKYKYTYDEKLLFLSLLAIPMKVELKKTNYINTLEVRKLILYLVKTTSFLSKENEKDQKANEKEFE